MTVEELILKLGQLDPHLEIYIDTGDDIAHNQIGVETVIELGDVTGYVLVEDKGAVEDDYKQLKLPFENGIH